MQHLERRRTALEDAHLAEVSPTEAVAVDDEHAPVGHDTLFRGRPSQPLAPREIDERVVLHDHFLLEAIETDLPLDAREVHPA